MRYTGIELYAISQRVESLIIPGRFNIQRGFHGRVSNYPFTASQIELIQLRMSMANLITGLMSVMVAYIIDNNKLITIDANSITNRQ